jgi:hypothetical protein
MIEIQPSLILSDRPRRRRVRKRWELVAKLDWWLPAIVAAAAFLWVLIALPVYLYLGELPWF